MSLLGFQVARLRDRDGGVFEVAEGMPIADVGEDASEVFSAAGPYEHRLVSLSGSSYDAQVRFLAAFPVGPESSPLLELDESGNPIAGSEASLQAILLANELLDSSRDMSVDPREKLKQIWGLLRKDGNAQLGELLFERLHHWAGTDDEEADDLPELFWLLPWQNLLPHLARLGSLLDRDKRSGEAVELVPDPSDQESLPDVSHLFRHLVPGLVPALREITEWRQNELAKLTNEDLRAFTRRLGRVSPDQLPDPVRSAFAEIADAIGRWVVHRLWIWTSSNDHLLAALIMADVYQFLLDLDAPFEGSVEAGRLKWMGRITLAAEAGFYPSGKLRLRRTTVDAMTKKAEELSGQLPLDQPNPPSDERQRDRLLDAAYTLFFAASTALTVEREPARALAFAQQARRAFELFGLQPLRYRIERWANVAPEAFLLEARSAIAASEFQAAADSLLAMSKLLDRRVGLKSHTRSLYRAELLLEADQVNQSDEAVGDRLAAELGIGSEHLVESALKISQNVLVANFSNRKAWRVIFAHADPEEAIGMIEETLEKESCEEQLKTPQRETLSWLEYQMALRARQLSESVPELILVAFGAYLRVLASQPFNTVALAEILECYSELHDNQLEEAKALLREHLAGVEDPAIPLTHATLRWAVCQEAPVGDPATIRTASQAIPILADSESDAATVEAAQRVLGEEVQKKHVAMVLEIFSKWIYDEARTVGDRNLLRAVARLLDPAVATLPNDAVWWTRRADIAITEHDVAVAESLMEEIGDNLRNDPIAHFQRARLLMVQGKLDGADRELIEASFLDRESTGEGVPHPAISDRRGFIALREGRYADAEQLYKGILAENGTDATAYYGLGRVFLENPEKGAVDAFERWRVSLRLRVTESAVTSSSRYAWQSAAAIAALVYSQLGSSPASRGTDDLLNGMSELVAVEDAIACRYVVDALRVRGVVDARTAAVVRSVRTRGLAQSVAQYLMARAVHVYIEDPDAWPGFVETELPDDIAWCRSRDVLGDFLAGAKGSYARAAMRVGVRPPRTDPARGYEPAPVGARKLRKLIDHVVDTSYSADYYNDAYRFLRAAKKVKDEQLIAVACEIVVRLATVAMESPGRGEGSEGYEGRLIESLRPSVGLETIGGVLGLDGGYAGLAGYVDLDALLYAKFSHGLERWELSGTQVTTIEPVSLSLVNRRRYARAGIDWNARQTGDLVYGCVNLLPAALEALPRGPSHKSEASLALVQAGDE